MSIQPPILSRPDLPASWPDTLSRPEVSVPDCPDVWVNDTDGLLRQVQEILIQTISFYALDLAARADVKFGRTVLQSLFN